MGEVLGALQVERGRQLDLLTLLERERRAALRHRLLGLPVGVVAGPHLVDQRGIRRTRGLELLRVVVPAERIDDRGAQDHAADRGVDRRA